MILNPDLHAIGMFLGSTEVSICNIVLFDRFLTNLYLSGQFRRSDKTRRSTTDYIVVPSRHGFEVHAKGFDEYFGSYRGYGPYEEY